MMNNTNRSITIYDTFSSDQMEQMQARISENVANEIKKTIW